MDKIKNRIAFKIKTGYKLDLSTPGTIKLLASIKKVVDKVVLVYCNLVKSDYQYTSKVLFTFVPNKQFGQLINIPPYYLTMMNTINTEFSSVEVGLTGQVSKVLEIEDNVNLTLIIG